jgi:sugar O-acyltransferase (sialic acid O-acetyltransferase NeuD family)
MDKFCLIGYSGHSFVVFDNLNSNGFEVIGYCEQNEKKNNPWNLTYFGNESKAIDQGLFETNLPVLAIGDNLIREKLVKKFQQNSIRVFTAIHKKAYLSVQTIVGEGTVIMANATVNPFATIGIGVICNTASLIEHECKIGNFTHICPGAVLAGNVTVGQRSFIGANSVVRQGINIGDDVIVGAGSVVTKDIPSRTIVWGNPAKIIAK